MKNISIFDFDLLFSNLCNEELKIKEVYDFNDYEHVDDEYAYKRIISYLKENDLSISALKKDCERFEKVTEYLYKCKTLKEDTTTYQACHRLLTKYNINISQYRDYLKIEEFIEFELHKYVMPDEIYKSLKELTDIIIKIINIEDVDYNSFSDIKSLNEVYVTVNNLLNQNTETSYVEIIINTIKREQSTRLASLIKTSKW